MTAYLVFTFTVSKGVGVCVKGDRASGIPRYEAILTGWYRQAEDRPKFTLVLNKRPQIHRASHNKPETIFAVQRVTYGFPSPCTVQRVTYGFPSPGTSGFPSPLHVEGYLKGSQAHRRDDAAAGRCGAPATRPAQDVQPNLAKTFQQRRQATQRKATARRPPQ